MSLLWKVLLTVTAAVAIALLTISLLASQGASRASVAYATTVLQQQAETLAAQVARQVSAGASWEEAQQWLNDTTKPGAMMMGHGGQGAGMMRNREHMMGGRSWTLLDATSGVLLASNGTPVQPEAVAVAVPVLVNDESVALLAPTALPSGATAAEAAFMAQVNRAIGVAALAAGVVALVTGALLAASILRPLQRLETAVAQIAQGDLAARVERPGPDEVGRLGDAFNRMAAGLQEQEELRRRLVADIAHELRTPLSVVQGNLQALLDGIYPLTTDEVRLIHDETRLLTRLVNDLHELAQAEARRLPLALQPVDVAEALTSTAERFAPLAAVKGVTLRVDGAPAALCVRADPERLAQILHNLVGNALRHTPSGGVITLAGEMDAADSARTGHGVVRFSVRDSGPGIALADLPHVFDRFYRAERDRARAKNGAPESNAPETTGAGLGLAIVKALVEAHGGAVGVESRPGEGACFWLTLPAAGDDLPVAHGSGDEVVRVGGRLGADG